MAAAGVAGAAAAPSPEHDFDIQINKTGNGLIISKYKGNAAVIVVPPVIQGMPVVEIGAEAFASAKQTANSITLPDAVVSINDRAFKNCSKLTSVTLPSALETIGIDAFAGTGLITIELPASLKSISSGAFSGSALTSVAIPSGVNIGASAFQMCKSLKSVTFKGDVTFTSAAFWECSSLESVTVNGSVKTVYGKTQDGFPENNFKGTKMSIVLQAEIRKIGYKGSF
jgi:hypothetical protein